MIKSILLMFLNELNHWSALKPGSTFAIHETKTNEYSNKILVDMRSEQPSAFFRFTVVARSDALPDAARPVWPSQVEEMSWKMEMEMDGQGGETSDIEPFIRAAMIIFPSTTLWKTKYADYIGRDKI
jgi:hypothetical protein